MIYIQKLIFIIILFPFVISKLTAKEISNNNIWHAGIGYGHNGYELIELYKLNNKDGLYAWEIFTGFSLGNYFGVEFGYKNLGTNTVSKLPNSKLSLAFTGKLPIDEDWSIVTEIGFVDELSSIFEPGGQSPFGGIGINYQLRPNMSVQGIYRRYDSLDIDNMFSRNIGSNHLGFKINYYFISE